MDTFESNSCIISPSLLILSRLFLDSLLDLDLSFLSRKRNTFLLTPRPTFLAASVNRIRPITALLAKVSFGSDFDFPGASWTSVICESLKTLSRPQPALSADSASFRAHGQSTGKHIRRMGKGYEGKVWISREGSMKEDGWMEEDGIDNIKRTGSWDRVGRGERQSFMYQQFYDGSVLDMNERENRVGRDRVGRDRVWMEKGGEREGCRGGELKHSQVRLGAYHCCTSNFSQRQKLLE